MPLAVNPWLKLELSTLPLVEVPVPEDVLLEFIELPAVGLVELKIEPDLNPEVEFVCANPEPEHSRTIEIVASFRIAISPLTTDGAVAKTSYPAQVPRKKLTPG
jgi:hypothetical protein